MTLHPAIVADLLDTEIVVARERLGTRISDLARSGNEVHCVIEGTNVGTVTLALNGTDYDAEPLRVTVLSPDGAEAPPAAWPGSLHHSIHPVLGRPFACVQGTYEYHCHPSHLSDPWDAYRSRIRLAELLDHLVKKARQ